MSYPPEVYKKPGHLGSDSLLIVALIVFISALVVVLANIIFLDDMALQRGWEPTKLLMTDCFVFSLVVCLLDFTWAMISYLKA